MKTQCYDEVPVSQTVHKNYVDYKIFCTQHGKPVNEELEVNLSSYYTIPDGAYKTYGTKTLQELRGMITEKLK